MTSDFFNGLSIAKIQYERGLSYPEAKKLYERILKDPTLGIDFFMGKDASLFADYDLLSVRSVLTNEHLAVIGRVIAHTAVYDERDAEMSLLLNLGILERAGQNGVCLKWDEALAKRLFTYRVDPKGAHIARICMDIAYKIKSMDDGVQDKLFEIICVPHDFCNLIGAYARKYREMQSIVLIKGTYEYEDMDVYLLSSLLSRLPSGYTYITLVDAINDSLSALISLGLEDSEMYRVTQHLLAYIKGVDLKTLRTRCADYEKKTGKI